MTSRLTEIGVDCADPAALARFWCAALGYVVHDDAGDLVTIGPAEPPDHRAGPGAPVVTFARVPEGKAGKNRLHLDVNPVDLDQGAEVARLLDLGARRCDIGPADATWVTLTDPEGNEFCVLGTRLV